MYNLLKKAILSGAGLASVSTEKLKQLAKDLEKKEKLTSKEGEKLFADLKKRAEKAQKELSRQVESVVHDTLDRMPIATRKEVEQLKHRLDNLEKKGAPKKKATSAKKTKTGKKQ